MSVTKIYESTNGARQFHKKITLYKLAEHFVFTHSALYFQFEKHRSFSIIKIVYSLLFSKISL